MKSPLLIAIYTSVIALVIKLTIFLLGVQHGVMEHYYRYIVMGLLLLCIFFSMKTFDFNKENTGTFPLLRLAIKSAVFFTLIFSGIVYIYYKKIDTEFFAIKQRERIEILKKEIPIMLKKESKEKVIKKLSLGLATMRKILSPYFQATWTMFGLTFLGMVYSILLMFLFKKKSNSIINE